MAFENEIAAHVEAISTGEDFKIYMERNSISPSLGSIGAIGLYCIWGN